MASRTSRSDLRRAVVLLVGCALLAAGCTVGGRQGGRADAGGSPQTEEMRRRAMYTTVCCFGSAQATQLRYRSATSPATATGSSCAVPCCLTTAPGGWAVTTLVLSRTEVVCGQLGLRLTISPA
jgi:hypothetical protein